MQADYPRIDLAREAGFALGAARVEPACLSVCGPDGESHSVQPRVMQVLVALHRAGGQTVTREELNQRCWDGRVVGDDALDRVMAQLRRLSDACAGAFRVDTIPRVGFRLEAPACAGVPPDRLPEAPERAAAEDAAARDAAREALRLLERAIALEPERRSPLMLVALCSALLELTATEATQGQEPPRLLLSRLDMARATRLPI